MQLRYAGTIGFAVGTAMLAMSSSGWADGGWYGSRGHAFGGSHHRMQAHGKWAHSAADRLLRHKQELGLSDDQVAKLKGLALERDVAAIKTHAAVMLAAREVRALVSDEKADLSTIEAKINEQEQLEGKLKMIGIKARRDAYAVLTPEQRDKLQTLREQIRQRYRSHMMMKADAGAPDQGNVFPAVEAARTEISESEEADQAG